MEGCIKDTEVHLCIQNRTHIHALPSGLPFKMHTRVISLQNHPERNMFIFLPGLNSSLKVYVLNTIIVSPFVSWPLVAKQPCLPILEPLKHMHTDGGCFREAERHQGLHPKWCKSVPLTHCTCCWLNSWLNIHTSYVIMCYRWQMLTLGVVYYLSFGITKPPVLLANIL